MCAHETSRQCGDRGRGARRVRAKRTYVTKAGPLKVKSLLIATLPRSQRRHTAKSISPMESRLGAVDRFWVPPLPFDRREHAIDGSRDRGRSLRDHQHVAERPPRSHEAPQGGRGRAHLKRRRGYRKVGCATVSFLDARASSSVRSAWRAARSRTSARSRRRSAASYSPISRRGVAQAEPDGAQDR